MGWADGVETRGVGVALTKGVALILEVGEGDRRGAGVEVRVGSGVWVGLATIGAGAGVRNCKNQ